MLTFNELGIGMSSDSGTDDLENDDRVIIN